MKRTGLFALAVAIVMGGVGQAKADVSIAGPALTSAIVGHTETGIEFTVSTTTALQSVVYVNQGALDTIQLLSSTKTVLDSVTVPAGNPSFTASGLNWALTPGDYFLQVTTNSPSNGMLAPYDGTSYYPASDTDLRVNYSFFNNGPTVG